MDPSYNNPQYYPPPQQNYPTQQGYPPVNPYPPQQGYSPYQSPQQGYPPANPYQSPQQQPQAPNNNNRDEWEEPWCKSYKITLYILLGLRILGLFSVIYTMLMLSVFNLSFVFTAIITTVEIAVTLIQFLAINKKDLQKAKIALIGFIGCYCTWIAYQIFIWLRFDRYTALGSFLTITIYFVLSLSGSVKVYQTLNASNTNQIKSNNYDSYYTA